MGKAREDCRDAPNHSPQLVKAHTRILLCREVGKVVKKIDWFIDWLVIHLGEKNYLMLLHW